MTVTRDRIPLLRFSETSPGFDGDLFFVLGQGLGDTVNGLRILKIVREKFTKARYIVYADKRWKSLLEAIPELHIRWYPDAYDVRNPSQKGAIGPYDLAEKEMKSALKKKDRAILWAFGHFLLPDQFSRGETTLETIARTIGISLSPENKRPYIPLNPEIGSDRDLLASLGLVETPYITLCPHTWSARMWGLDRFTELGKLIAKQSGYKIVVIGLPELGKLPIPEAIHTFGCSLLDVARILRYSRLFVGQDSGITHMAAAFDLSIIGIYVNAIFPTPEVRPLSPFASLVIEPDPPQSHQISFETVFNLSMHLLRRKTLNPSPRCPSCSSNLDYVVEAKGNDINRMCVCGIQYRERIDLPVPETRGIEKSSLGIPVLDTGSGHTRIDPFSLGEDSPEPVEITMPVRNPFRPYLLDDVAEWPPGRAILSQDGMMALFRKHGMSLTKTNIIERSNDSESWTYRFSRVPGKRPFLLPWGGKYLKLKDFSLYMEIFNWNTWSTHLRWSGIAKAALKAGDIRSALKISIVIFRFDPTIKNFKNLIRSLLRFLFFKTMNV